MFVHPSPEMNQANVSQASADLLSINELALWMG
jgi:hypothetical protein